MASFREEVIARALNNRPGALQSVPKFGTFQWRAQASSSGGITNPEVPFTQIVYTNNISVPRFEDYDILVAQCQGGIPPYRYTASLSSFPSGITLINNGNEVRVRGYLTRTLSTFQFNLTAYDSSNRFVIAGPISFTGNEASFEKRFPYFIALTGANETSTNSLYYRLSTPDYGVYYTSLPRPFNSSLYWSRQIFAPNKGTAYEGYTQTPNRLFWHVTGQTSGPDQVYYTSNLTASDFAPVSDLTSIVWRQSASSAPAPVAVSLRDIKLPRYIKVDGSNNLGMNNIFVLQAPGTGDFVSLTGISDFNTLYFPKEYDFNREDSYEFNNWITPPFQWNNMEPNWTIRTISISIRLRSNYDFRWSAPVNNSSILWSSSNTFELSSLVPLTAVSITSDSIPNKILVASVINPFRIGVGGQVLNYRPVIALSGVGPYLYTGLSLPLGFNLDSSTGFLSGIPVLSSFSNNTDWYQIKITDLGTNYSSIGSFQLGASAATPLPVISDIDHYFTFGRNIRYRGIDVNNIVKINSFGMPDTTFNFPVSGNTKEVISVLPVQNNTKWLIQFNESNTYPGTTSNIIRLNRSFNSTNPFGSLDNTFNVTGTGVNAPAQIIENADGSYYLIGDNAGFNPVRGYNGTYGYDKILKVKQNGDIDTSFTTIEPDIRTLPMSGFRLTDGSLSYIRGIYLSAGDLGLYNNKPIWCGYLEDDITSNSVCANTIGWDDLNGTGNFAWEIYDTNGGYGTYYNPTDGPYPWIGTWIPRVSGPTITTTPILTSKLTITQDGFEGPLGGYYIRGCPTSNNKVIVIGFFNKYRGNLCNNITRINSDGTFDNTFNQGGSGLSDGIPWQIIRSRSGLYYILIRSGGRGQYNGVSFNNIIRITEDGAIDPTFTAPLIAYGSTGLYGIVEQSDGKLLIHGEIWSVNGIDKSNIIRLNADGTLDNSFEAASEINWTPETGQLTVDRRNNVFFFGACLTQPSTTVTLLNSGGSYFQDFVSCGGFNAIPPSCPVGINGVFALTALPGIPHEPVPCPPAYAAYSANFIPLRVTLSGSGYVFDQYRNTLNPTITCFRGTNYDFDVNTPGQPFRLRTSISNETVNGSFNNLSGGVVTGKIMFTPTINQTSPLFYQSTANPSISGLIIIRDY